MEAVSHASTRRRSRPREHPGEENGHKGEMARVNFRNKHSLGMSQRGKTGKRGGRAPGRVGPSDTGRGGHRERVRELQGVVGLGRERRSLPGPERVRWWRKRGACPPGGCERRAGERDQGRTLSAKGASVISASLEKRWDGHVRVPHRGHCVPPAQGP